MSERRIISEYMLSSQNLSVITSLAAIFLILLWIYRLRCRKHLSPWNKAVFITGCGSGFGHDLALRLSSLGYQVYAGCHSIKGQGPETLRATPGVEVLHLDVTDQDSVSSAAKSISQQLGDNVLWAIVNNAGIAQIGEMEWCPMEVLQKVFDVNTFGVVRVTKEFLPLLRKSRGRIVNVTSITGKRRIPGCIGYAMSKAASSSFNDAIRLELKKWEIDVIEVAPYFYSTPMLKQDRIEELQKRLWDLSPKETRDALGVSYFKKYVTFSCKWPKFMCEPNGNEVVNCLVNAIASKSPKLHYHPGNLVSVLVIDILEYLPSSAKDFIQYLFLPKPDSS